MFVMLNPSTADANLDDPTIRRCIRFAQSWGYGRLEVVNLFAYRATDPKKLRELSATDAIGELNRQAFTDTASIADLIVCAWGTNGNLHDQDKAVMQWLPSGKTVALAVTKNGFPMHPLYVPSKAVLTPYIGRTQV